ncbi:MAG: hypothetical protein EBU23_18345, partial [Mycobacteriaceae bacterium]|nr:hypothetical protein [Mycobacteriaceae bacterium]
MTGAPPDTTTVVLAVLLRIEVSDVDVLAAPMKVNLPMAVTVRVAVKRTEWLRSTVPTEHMNIIVPFGRHLPAEGVM